MPFSVGELSYGLLWIVTGLTSVLLQRALTEVLQAGDHLAEIRPIERLPEFTVPVRGSAHSLSTHEVIGAEVTFLFVGAESQTPELHARLLGSLHVFRRRTPKVYLVASGALELNDAIPFESAAGVAVLLDREKQLAKRFNVTETPSAVIFGADGRFIKRGKMSWEDSLEDSVGPSQTEGNCGSRRRRGPSAAL